MKFIITKSTGGVIEVDTDNPAPGVAALGAYIDERVAAGVAPVQAQLDAALAERDEAKTSLVGEVVRIQRLATPALDVEATTKHLATFTVAQLGVELERAKASFKDEGAGGSTTKNVDNPDAPEGADPEKPKPNKFLAPVPSAVKAA